MKITDREIIENLAAGNTERIRQEKILYSEYVYFVNEGCRKYNLTREESCSAYNDAFLSAVINITSGRFDGRSSIKTYLYQIFLNKCIDLMRRKAVNKQKISETTERSGINEQLYAQNSVADFVFSEENLSGEFLSKNSYLKRSISFLGIARLKPYSEIENNADLIDYIREGIPHISLEELMIVTDLTSEEINGNVYILHSTYNSQKFHQKLNPSQTERLIEIAKLYSRGEEVFGNLDYFKNWMESNVISLGNKKPKSFLDTSLGIDMLMAELGRIEHGVFA